MKSQLSNGVRKKEKKPTKLYLHIIFQREKKKWTKRINKS